MVAATTAEDEAALDQRRIPRNREGTIWGNNKRSMSHMSMSIHRLIMITMARSQALNTPITKENNTEPTSTVVLLEDPIVRNFTIKNNEI